MGKGAYAGIDLAGARIWSLLQQPWSVEEICDMLVAEDEVKHDRCEAHLPALVERRRGKGLIEVQNDAAA